MNVIGKLGLRTYGDPIIHRTSRQGKARQGKDLSEGYNASVPLIDSGIYIAAPNDQRIFSFIARLV